MRPDRVVIGCESERAAAVMKAIYRPLYLIETPMVMTESGNRRTDQIRLQRFSRDQDHLHQRDRRSVREGRRRCADGRQRHGARWAHRAQIPACGARLWRLVLSRRIRWRSRAPRGIAACRCAWSKPTIEVNDKRKKNMATRIIAACGGSVTGKTIAMLGVTFKPNTDDMRDSVEPRYHAGVAAGGRARSAPMIPPA